MLGTIANSCNPKTLKKNYISLNTLVNKAKMHNNQNVMKRRSWSHPKSLINESIMGNKETSNSITEKQGNRNKEITHETWNANSFVKLNNRMSHPASSVETSQFLKMHVGKTLFQKNVQNKPGFPKRLYPYRIRDLEDTRVTQKSDVNSITNTKFGISIANVPLASKSNLSGNAGFSCDQMKNDIIVCNNRHTKKNENDLKSLVTVEENVEDNYTSYSIGKETKLDNVKQPSTCLKKDKAVYDLISAHSLMNRRFFEKLRDKGLVRPQVEFSMTR